MLGVPELRLDEGENLWCVRPLGWRRMSDGKTPYRL